ncbi:MAG: hypothetical protein D6741_01845, partial [Planctomycetota bacterium]
WGATFVLWIFLAVSLWATLKGLGVEPVGPALLPRCVASAALATVAGFLILVLPGGLGVREAVLVALIAPYLETLPEMADRAELIACVTAAMLRLEWVAAEVVVSAALYVARPRSLDAETDSSACVPEGGASAVAKQGNGECVSQHAVSAKADGT